jgi:hypothetical protein
VLWLQVQSGMSSGVSHVVSSLSVAFGNLRITFAQTHTTTDEAVLAATEPAGGADPVQSPAPKRAAPPARSATTRGQRVRFYCCTHVPRGSGLGERLLGIHRCTWADLEAALPKGKLFGSGCRLTGFDTEGEVLSHWTARGLPLPAPRHF